ncbi:hypothetical protein TAL182_CH02240 [Rhizobium sp. TAL182]|nr:hypothetical protein [Rhizobium sp. TAL182]ARO23998.1 hypothetical protein TAL182_CH02240 [Rhizobium sp. TAL182]
MEATRIQNLLKQADARIQMMLRLIQTHKVGSQLDQLLRRLEYFSSAVREVELNPTSLTMDGLDEFFKEVDTVEGLLKHTSLSHVAERRLDKRDSAGLSLHEDCSYIRNLLRGVQFGLNKLDVPLTELPSEPVQSHGPRFSVVQGKLDFAPGEELDSSKNHIARIKSIIPILRAEVDDAIELFGRNTVHARIHRCLVNYSEAIRERTIDYNMVAAFGTLLGNAEKASHRDIQDRLVPELGDSEKAALGSILDLHGPLLLATEIGREYLSDAAEYNRTPEQQTTLRSASVDLATAIAEEGIATERTESFITETAANIGSGTHPSRSAILGTNTIRNVSAVMVLGALALFPSQLAMTASWIAAVLIAEGAKRS